VTQAAHAALGASGASRWLNCPGSVKLSEGYVRAPSRFAAEGQAAHWLAEHCLLNDKAAQDFVGQDWASPEGGLLVWIDQDMADHILEYLSALGRLRETADDFEVEERVTLDGLWTASGDKPPAPMFGTLDCGAYYRNEKTLTIIDLKYGKGIAVGVEDNEQLWYYALGKLLRLIDQGEKVLSVNIGIFQPRVQGGDPWKWSKVPAIDILMWGVDVLKPGAEATVKPNAPLVTGKWCQFCAARAVCPELAKLAVTTAQMEFDHKPPRPDTLAGDVIANILDRAFVIKMWLSAVQAYASKAIESGTEVPGWYLKERRAQRKWTDDGEALGALLSAGFKKDDVTVNKLLTVAKVEKIIKKGGFDLNATFGQVITKTSPGTTLAVGPGHNPGSRFTPTDPGSDFDTGDDDETDNTEF